MMGRLSRAAMTLGLVFLLAACGGAAATVTPPPTATAVPPTATAVPPTATAVPPTATAVPPTATAVPPTATAVPPTATAVPPTATAVPPTATRPAPTATTAARPSAAPATGGKVMVDAEKKCQVTLPATFTADSAGGGNATSNDNNAFLNLVSLDPTLGLQATTDLFVNGFKGSIDGYKETNRQSGTDRGRPYIVVTYTGTLSGEPIVGQFYFVQEPASICTMTFLVKQAVSAQYGDTVGALADSLQAVKP